MARPKKEAGFDNEQEQGEEAPSLMRKYEQWEVSVSYSPEFDANKSVVNVPKFRKKGREPLATKRMEYRHAATLNTNSGAATNVHRWYDAETGEAPVHKDENGNPLIWEVYE